MMSFIFRTIKVVRLLEKTSPILFLKSQRSLLIKPLLFVKKNTNKKQYRYYCIAKEPVLRCNIGTFGVQNRHFYNAKQWVLQCVDIQLVECWLCS